MQGISKFNVLTKPKKEENDELPKIYIKAPLASSTIKSNGNNKSEDLKLGFANLPEQMQRKAVKKGFNFTLMVVGESGLGKSTFVNSLLNQSIYTEPKDLNVETLLSSTTKIEKHFIELDEKGVKLRMTIVDTPGFGDGIDCRECWKPIVDYVDETFYQYFKEECAISRKNIQDNRVHCCLYFISPIGHGIKLLDIDCLKVLHNKVNIVPIIAKADNFTESELKKFKLRVIKDLEEHNINYYQPPICGSDEEDEFRSQDAEIRAAVPFSVIGSNAFIENENGKKIRGRDYGWGVVEVENSKHCNFNILRTFVLRTHMQDLKDVTNDLLYENYRGELIQTRMNKRNNDRYATINSKAESTVSSIEDMVESSNLLHEKEEEIQRLQGAIFKMQTQFNESSESSASPTISLSSRQCPPLLPGSNSPAVSVKSSSTISSAK